MEHIADAGPVESVLLDAGYRFAAFDGINRFYVDRDHENLIPVLAYPVCALDRFVTASSLDLHDRLDRALGDLRETTTDSDELVDARRALDAVYQSRTWRAGRIIAAATRPFRAIDARLRKWSSSLTRPRVTLLTSCRLCGSGIS